jgi:hypothetical protein
MPQEANMLAVVEWIFKQYISCLNSCLFWSVFIPSQWILGAQAIEQDGIFIVPRLLWHGTCLSSLIGRTTQFIATYDSARGCWGHIHTPILTGPHPVASYDTQGDAENPFLHGSSHRMISENWEKGHFSEQFLKTTPIYGSVLILHSVDMMPAAPPVLSRDFLL